MFTFLRLFAFQLLLISPFLAAAGTYYVSPTGSNGSTGTQADPLFLIQEAIDKCVSGQDTVWLVEGSYWQRFTIVNKQGIYLSSLDAANKSTVSGSGVVGLNQILIQDSDSITIANLILRENFEQEANAIYVVGEGDGIFITDNEIFNVGWGPDPTLDPESFTPVRQAHGILINGRTNDGYRNVYLGRNYLHDLIVGNSEVITLIGNVFNFLIEDNTIERATNIGIDIAGHYAWAFPDTLDPANNQTRAGRIRNNTVSECKRPTPGNEPAGIYVDGGKDVFIDGNRTFNNGTGISVGCENVGVAAENITVANNLIYNQDKFGMVFGANVGEVLNSTVRNNTFFNNGMYVDNSGSLALQKSTDAIIRNNLIYLTSEDYFGLSLFGFLVTNLQIDHNLFFSPAGNTARVYAYSPAMGSTQTADTVFFADPLLTNPDSAMPDFHLLAGSPAVDAGSDQISLIPGETDIDGTLRTANGIDIGADELEGSAGFERLAELGLRCFPNPFSQQLTIESELPGLQAVRLFAPNGAEVWYQSAEGSQRLELSLRDLPRGLYLLQIEHRLGTNFQKVWRE